MMAVFKHGLDRVLDKFVSRKLLVWIISTIFMYMAKIESSDWVMISMVYLGSQGALDVAERLTKARNTTTSITENKNA
jgi:hypothetical protein